MSAPVTEITVNLRMLPETYTSVEDHYQKADVRLFPNPSGEEIFLFSSAEDTFDYQILSLDGRIINSGHLRQQGKAIPIDISGLRSGIYIVMLQSSSSTYSLRFIRK